MNNTKNQSLKIGKISTAVEVAFNSAFAIRPDIYFLQEDLDRLASTYPERYLRLLEEYIQIIQSPDLVCYCKEEMFYIYFRLYAQKGRFRVLGIRILLKGKPNVWAIDGLREYKNEDLAWLEQKAVIKRVDTKLKRSRKKKSK